MRGVSRYWESTSWPRLAKSALSFALPTATAEPRKHTFAEAGRDTEKSSGKKSAGAFLRRCLRLGKILTRTGGAAAAALEEERITLCGLRREGDAAAQGKEAECGRKRRIGVV